MKVLQVNLGKSHFKDSWDIQKLVHSFKQDRKINDIIISTEHYPVYTLGKSGERDHLLAGEDELKQRNIEYYEIDRGGDITYHGPGQLVVYPIFNLNNFYKDIHRFLRDLEESVIITLDHFGITGTKDEEFTGVWVGEEKICALGIKVSRWITMHGLALNVNNELTNFGRIIPCGIFHKGVTSISKILKTEIDIDEVRRLLIENMGKIFGFESEEITTDDLFQRFSISKSILD